MRDSAPTQLKWTALLFLSCEFDIKSGNAVLLVIRSCWCDRFHKIVHCLFSQLHYQTNLADMPKIS